MRHITEQDIKNFYQETLSVQEETDFLQHISTCEYCAGRMAAGIPQEQMITPPIDLSQQILAEARRIPAKKKRTYRRTLFLYSVKIVIVTSCTVALIFFSNFLPAPGIPARGNTQQAPIATETATGGLHSFLNHSSYAVNQALKSFSGHLTQNISFDDNNNQSDKSDNTNK